MDLIFQTKYKFHMVIYIRYCIDIIFNIGVVYNSNFKQLLPLHKATEPNNVHASEEKYITEVMMSRCREKSH